MIFKESTNILENLINSSQVITKIRDNYLKEYNSYLKLMEAPNYTGVYHIEMYRDYIDETIKTKLSRIFSFIKPSTYKRYVNMAIIGLSELLEELTIHNDELNQHREELLLNLGFLLILEDKYDSPLALRDRVIDNYFSEIAEFKLNCFLYCFSRKRELVQDEHSGEYFIKDLLCLGYFDVEKFEGCYRLKFHIDNMVDNKLNGKFILSNYGFPDKEKAFEIELNLDSNKETIFFNKLKSSVKNRDKLNPKLVIVNEEYNLNTDIRNLLFQHKPDAYIEFDCKGDNWFIKVNDPVNPRIYCIPDNNIEATEVKENGIIYTIIKNFSYNQGIKLMCRMSDVPFLNTK